jgi:hypothetical protein
MCIHLCSLPCNRSISSPKASFPQSAFYSAFSFNFHYLLFSLKLSSSWLHHLPCLLVTYIIPSVFPSITRSRRQFLCQMWPILLFIACRLFFFSLTLCHTSSFLTWSVQLISSFSCTTFQNLLGICDILSEVTIFQHHMKLRAKCSSFLFSS